MDVPHRRCARVFRNAPPRVGASLAAGPEMVAAGAPDESRRNRRRQAGRTGRPRRIRPHDRPHARDRPCRDGCQAAESGGAIAREVAGRAECAAEGDRPEAEGSARHAVRPDVGARRSGRPHPGDRADHVRSGPRIGATGETVGGEGVAGAEETLPVADPRRIGTPRRALMCGFGNPGPRWRHGRRKEWLESVASKGRLRDAGAQAPECTRQYMRMPSTAGAQDAERSSFRVIPITEDAMKKLALAIAVCAAWPMLLPNAQAAQKKPPPPAGSANNAGQTSGGSQDPLQMEANPAQWVMPGKNYYGQRFSKLNQINTG